MTQSTNGQDSTATSVADESAPSGSFDLRKDPIPSFSELLNLRGQVYGRRTRLESFRRTVESLGTSGEEGRRKGLGLWMLGRPEEAVAQLAAYDSDDVASFTRAHALLHLERAKEALPIFKRLSDAYPDATRPRAGALEAQFELDLAASDDPAKAVEALRAALAKTSDEFRASADGEYLTARAYQAMGEFETALDHYDAAVEDDQTHRPALLAGARLAERCGLDDQALEWYEALARVLPIDRGVLFNLGVLYEDMGRDQKAAACYETITRTFPTDARARLYLADARSGIDMYYDEDLERKEDRLNTILRTPITDFELSVRARNCLNKMDIVTLGDLVKLTEAELLSYKNFGETSLNEIKEILASKNLRLGMNHSEAVASIEAMSRPRATGENADVLNKPISDLDLSIRARRTVENVGCLTVGDIVQHAEEELLSMPNFGVTSLQELKRKLSELGLKLAERGK